MTEEIAAEDCRLAPGLVIARTGLPEGSFMEALFLLGVSVSNLSDEQLAHEFRQA